jgi:hypothetical protein
MKIYNEEGIVHGLLDEDYRKEMEQAFRDGGECFLYCVDGWRYWPEPNWSLKCAYKVHAKLKKLSDEPWVNDWAKWRAVDEDGFACEFDAKPEVRSYFWHKNGGKQVRIGEGYDASDWENSLEEMPKPEPEVPENIDVMPADSDDSYQVLKEMGKAINWLLERARKEEE